MADAGGQAGDRHQADAQNHVADLGDAGIGQHSLDVGLEDRHHGCAENPHQGQRQQDLIQLHRFKREFGPENGEEEAQQHVDRYLGGGGRQEGRYHRGRVGVGVGQPEVERKQRQLQADADGQEGERGTHGAGVGHRRDAGGQIPHVQGAGHHVQQADADQNERGADRAHDQVLISGGQRAAVAADADQHVARQRRDFQKYEDVEGVAGNRDPQQAGQTQQVRRVKPGLLVFGQTDAALDDHPPEGHDDGPDPRHDQQHVGVERVHPVFDAPGHGPASHQIGNRAMRQHLVQQQGGHEKRQPARCHGRQPDRAAGGQQRAQRR